MCRLNWGNLREESRLEGLWLRQFNSLVSTRLTSHLQGLPQILVDCLVLLRKSLYDVPNSLSARGIKVISKPSLLLLWNLNRRKLINVRLISSPRLPAFKISPCSWPKWRVLVHFTALITLNDIMHLNTRRVLFQWMRCSFRKSVSVFIGQVSRMSSILQMFSRRGIARLQSILDITLTVH
jgi:hypothetical protein